MIHLNIGLRIDRLGDTDANSENAMLGRAWMARQCLARWGTIKRYGFAQSNTEMTLVIEVNAPIELCKKPLYELSSVLGQDAIAMLDPDTAEGVLIGHGAQDWGGQFLPEYFISPYGLNESELRYIEGGAE